MHLVKQFMSRKCIGWSPERSARTAKLFELLRKLVSRNLLPNFNMENYPQYTECTYIAYSAATVWTCATHYYVCLPEKKSLVSQTWIWYIVNCYEKNYIIHTEDVYLECDNNRSGIIPGSCYRASFLTTDRRHAFFIACFCRIDVRCSLPCT